MSTSDTPETPALTRRQLREMRQTGATPIITPQTQTDAGFPAVESEVPAESEAPAVREVPAEEAPEGPDAPADDARADETPARAQAPADEASALIEDVPAASAETAPENERPVTESSAAFGSYPAAGSDIGVTGLTRRQVRAQEKIRTASVPVISPDLDAALPHGGASAGEEALPAIFRPAAAESPTAADAPAPSVVNPALGSELLGGAAPDVDLPASFDDLLARNTGATGAVSTPNSLILSQTPAGAPLVGPVTATGEVMITGTFDLPEGLGSVGHGPGTTDGRDADAVLLDGELPAASSPTPIAASAAISTVKQPGEIIRPPAPEKGSKLLIGLIITTGALALLVAVSLGFAFTTGVFR